MVARSRRRLGIGFRVRSKRIVEKKLQMTPRRGRTFRLRTNEEVSEEEATENESTAQMI